jgi:glyoxylase-like metal-dependent hydrolase (beta-lactamase superfamily II)
MIFIEIVPSGPLQTNAILLGCTETKQAAVIDPAFGSTPKILQSAQQHGLKIDQIFLTHSHWDHIAEVHLLKEKTGAKVFVHPEDAGNLSSPGSDGLSLQVSIQGVEPDGFLEEGRPMNVGQLLIEVIHTPGHSPGGVCLYLPEEHVLFSGDTLFRGSIGHIHFSTGEPDRMWDSLKKLAALPLNTRVIAGHGKETTLAREQWLKDAKELLGE